MTLDSHLKYEEFHNSVYEADGVFNYKIKHLICLAAALGAGCEFCTKYAVSVLRKCGVSQEELDEVEAIAMTVGASKIKVQSLEAAEAVDENPDVECPVCGISDTEDSSCGGE